MHYMLKIIDGKIALCYRRPGAASKTDKVEFIESLHDYTCLILRETERLKCEVDDLTIMCSSAMDFPDEYTDDKKVIELAHIIRSQDPELKFARREKERKAMGRGKNLSPKHRRQLMMVQRMLKRRLAQIKEEVNERLFAIASIEAQLSAKLPKIEEVLAVLKKEEAIGWDVKHSARTS